MNLPEKIKKLDDVVINRIAAGEIIQRPANALKEMIENSLDAKSTNIQITVIDGGLKFLEIRDNGCGIRKEDFPIVCKRFTTSKLQKFEDLETISTYGFRGEALASISHVAHLNITSKTVNSPCAYKASFIDGVLKDKLKPIAGTQGTIITVEDLFYNMGIRKGALSSPSEEYAKVADVVGKYAIHNWKVGFSLKKGGNSVDIRTIPHSDIVDNIRVIFGDSIAKELSEFRMEDDAFKFKVYSQITMVNYSAKKFNFVLFINHRLVDCQSLKRSIDQIYSTYLPKNGHPFVYMSLEIEPKNVDVNVHPTKHEVHFLNEEQIVEMITTNLESKLLSSNNTRKFYRQEKLPCVIFETNTNNKTVNKTIYDKDLVRTCSSEQKLEKFFGPVTNKSLIVDEIDEAPMEVIENDLIEPTASLEGKLLEKTIVLPHNDDSDSQIIGSSLSDGLLKELPELKLKKTVKPEKTEENIRNIDEIVDKSKSTPMIPFKSTKQKVKITLKSVLSMQAKIERECNYSLRDLFLNHVYVGAVSPKQALIQYETRLILCDTETVLKELFYQVVAYNFFNLDRFKFESPIDLRELARIALNLEETGWTEEDGDKEELAKKVVTILVEHGDMLEEYFAMKIDERGFLHSLPILIKDYMPSKIGLPMYILRLATDVNWTEEKPCFESFCRETADYYSIIDEDDKDWQHTVEHVIYPFIKGYFCPNDSFKNNGALCEITTLPKLYKVFERC